MQLFSGKAESNKGPALRSALQWICVYYFFPTLEKLDCTLRTLYMQPSFEVLAVLFGATRDCATDTIGLEVAAAEHAACRTDGPAGDQV